MAGTTKAKSKTDDYLGLVLEFPLRPLRGHKELNRAIEIIDVLLDKTSRTQGEEDYLDVLSDLVHRYETKHDPIPRLSDADMLKHLMEMNGTSQAQLARESRIAESTISEILTGKRTLNRVQIGKMSRYFHVEPGVFNFDSCE